jgi:two-component system, cell cycle response regulator DivK
MPRILLVEDDKPNLEILVRRLTRSGYQVLTATTGAEARDLATTELPDVVLMDVGLPDHDGWEITRQLRAHPATQALPIIALTGHIMPDERESAIQAGCNDFHGKPVEFPRLLEQIAALLGKGGPS